jgi:hypothetical protein
MVSHRLRGPIESTELARWNFGAFDRYGAILPFHYGPADGRNQPFRSPWIRRRADYHPLLTISAPYRLDRRRTFPTVAPEFCSVRGAKPFTPCLEAYHLRRTRLELIAERKVRRRQLSDGRQCRDHRARSERTRGPTSITPDRLSPVCSMRAAQQAVWDAERDRCRSTPDAIGQPRW